MKISKVVASLVFATGFALSGPASATLFSVTATGNGVSLISTVTTGGADNGGFDITAITGTVNGFAITGLSTVFQADNILFPFSNSFNGSFLVDGEGLSVALVNGSDFNFFASGQGPGSPTLYAAVGDVGQTPVTLSVTPVAIRVVPEPESLALLALGLLALGAARRRRKA